MTELGEKIKEIYEKYREVGAGERKRSFGELFKGWFSGKGKETPPVDREFMELVTGCVKRIVEEGDRDDAVTAAETVLSMPRNKKFSEQDLCFAAMYSNVAQLIPMMTDGDVRNIRGLADEVPRQYRFPVYKDMIKALDERIKTR